MKYWQQFVDTLNTRGGSIFILLTATSLLLAGVLWHGEAGESGTLIRQTFAGFSGALLMSLTLSAKSADPSNTKPTQGD